MAARRITWLGSPIKRLACWILRGMLREQCDERARLRARCLELRDGWPVKIYRSGKCALIDLLPRSEGAAKFIQVGLEDVRSADDIRVSYDFDRDGWVVEQASRFEWDADDTVCDPDWAEVSFVQAWAREERKEPDA